MIYIIFDTNAAREFVVGQNLENLEEFAQSMAMKFEAHGLKLSISPLVIHELLYHLVDKNDKDFSISFKAIKVLMLVMEYQRKGAKRTMMSPSELLIANEIYHLRIESREMMYSQMMSIAEEIAHGNIDNIPDLHTIDGGTPKTYIDDIENAFAVDIRKVSHDLEVLANVSCRSFEEVLNSKNGEDLLITYFSRTTYNLLMNEGKVPDYRRFLPSLVPYSPESCREYFAFFNFMEKGNIEIKRRYPAFLKLAKEVVRRIHQSKNQISDEKLKNYVWDIKLMFHVNDHTINHHPFRFITSDKTMLLASGAFHDKNNVMNFSEFKKWLDEE